MVFRNHHHLNCNDDQIKALSMNFAIGDNFNVNIHEKMNNGLLNYMYMTISFQKKKMVCTCISRVSIQSGVWAAEPNDSNSYEYIALQSNEL